MTSKTPRREKHSETLEIRMPYSVKVEFMKACRENGVTASEVVRNYVGSYSNKRRTFVPPSNLFETMEFRMEMLVIPGLIGALFIGSLSLDQDAIAEDQSPAATLVRNDLDQDGYIDLDELKLMAGLDAEGRMSEEMRTDITVTVQEAIADYGPIVLEGTTADEFIGNVIAEAELSAAESILETFNEMDNDGDGRLSLSELQDA